jgi:alkaline phosphatase
VNEKKNLNILITGTRPKPAEYANYPDFIFFDDDLILPHTPEQWKRIGLVSLNFTKYSKWDGQTSIPRADKRLIKSAIAKAHEMDKPIRFWAAPDTQKSWKLQKKLKANFIGTDHIQELASFLNKHR